jgi:hypothetical protein
MKKGCAAGFVIILVLLQGCMIPGSYMMPFHPVEPIPPVIREQPHPQQQPGRSDNGNGGKTHDNGQPNSGEPHGQGPQTPDPPAK